MGVAASLNSETESAAVGAQDSVEKNIVFQSRDIRNLTSKSAGGRSYTFLGSCIATCCMWLSNVAKGMPLRMTKPDHVLAAMLQLKYLDVSRDECVEGLLEQLGLEGDKACSPADGESVLNAIKSTGDCMYIMLTQDMENGSSFVIPQMIAFVRRGGMTYFFDPAHGLFEYGPLQGQLLRRNFMDKGYDTRVFSYWTVRAVPNVDMAANDAALRRAIPAGRFSR